MVFHLTTTSPASPSLFKPMPPVINKNRDSSSGGNIINDPEASKLKIQMALDQILAEFKKGSNVGNNMRQFTQDSGLTQDRALQALLIDSRDNHVRQQQNEASASYAKQVKQVKQGQLLHQILFSPPQPPAPRQKPATSQFEAFPSQQQNNWWLYPPPNFQIANGLKQQGAYRGAISKAGPLKQSTKENHFSPMPAIPKAHHKASRIFRSNGVSTPDETSTPKRAPGMQFRTGRRISDLRSSPDIVKSKMKDEKSSSDVTSDDSSTSTDPGNQNPLYERLQVSMFRPLLPEALGPVTRSRSAGLARAKPSTSNETDLIMKIVTGSYEEIQKIIDEYKNKNVIQKQDC